MRFFPLLLLSTLLLATPLVAAEDKNSEAISSKPATTEADVEIGESDQEVIAELELLELLELLENMNALASMEDTE